MAPIVINGEISPTRDAYRTDRSAAEPQPNPEKTGLPQKGAKNAKERHRVMWQHCLQLFAHSAPFRGQKFRAATEDFDGLQCREVPRIASHLFACPNDQRCLAVIMPAFNEERTIGIVIERVLKNPSVIQLIIVNDGSTDRTRAVIELRSQGDVRVKVCHHASNLGKGACVRTGLLAVTAPVVIIQDADLEYDPEDYGKVIAPIIEGETNVAFGSRFLAQPRFSASLMHRLANECLTRLANFVTGLRLTDMETCYKAFRTEIFRQIIIEEDRFGVEPELTLKVANLGLRIVEVPISYRPRSRHQGKKIGWRDGLDAVRCILRYSVKPCVSGRSKSPTFELNHHPPCSLPDKSTSSSSPQR